MRPVSKKRAALNHLVKPIREEYAYEYPKCEVFCCSSDGVDIHEIARGQFRRKALSEPAAWLHLCRSCHDQMGWFNVTKQLALKKMSGSGYDRRAVNLIRNPKTPDAITEAEVDAEVKWFQDEPMKALTICQ